MDENCKKVMTRCANVISWVVDDVDFWEDGDTGEGVMEINISSPDGKRAIEVIEAGDMDNMNKAAEDIERMGGDILFENVCVFFADPVEIEKNRSMDAEPLRVRMERPYKRRE